MSIKLRNRLSFSQARQAVIAAFVLGMMLSAFQIGADFLTERKQMDGTISQIVQMMIGPAARSAYQLDQSMAESVINGLFEYKPIAKVKITDEFGRNILFSSEREVHETEMRKMMSLVFGKNKNYVFPLVHDNDQKIGLLHITVDPYLMAGNFIGRSGVIMISGLVRNVVLAIILTLIFYKSLTRPLLRMVKKLSEVDLETPADGKLNAPLGHELDEMGLLVHSINGLLTGFDESLTDRLAAEQQVAEREALISGIMNNVPDSILTINETGEVEACNRSAMELFGDVAPLVGFPVRCLFHKFEKSLLSERINDSFVIAAATESGSGRGLDRTPLEMTALSKKGDEKNLIPVEIHFGEMHMQQGWRLICVVNDISERKESETALRVSEKKYKLLSENLELEVKRKTQEIKETHSQLLHQEKLASIGHLAAGVAHEINNPMGFIMSNLKTLRTYLNDLAEAITVYSDFVEDLKKTSSSLSRNNDLAIQLCKVQEQIGKLDLDYLLDDAPNLVKESLGGAERINRIVSDLKDFAHPGEESPTYTDLTQCIESTMNIVSNELKYKTEVIRTYSTIPKIYCYPRQLNQVIMNLLINAVQAIEKKGIIEITTQDLGDCVALSIRDTGQGVSEKNISKIFDPFFTTKDVGEGTGLGLNMVHNIILKHKGTITVESQVGEGTIFTIKLLVNPEL